MKLCLIAFAMMLTFELLPSASAPAAAAGCGAYRWSVQTLSDPDRRLVSTTPTDTDVPALRAIPAAVGLDASSPRQAPDETTLWTIHARILKAARRPNGDVRAVVVPRDDVRQQMLVVLHAPRCIGSPYRRDEQAAARRALLERCGPLGSTWTRLGGLVTVTGAGFWDLRPTSGAAPNGLQLNPVVGFRGECWHRDARFTVMLTGDSVPHQLGDALAAATGWRILDATAAGCPVTGEEPTDLSGSGLWTSRGDCRDHVVAGQRRLLQKHPDLVLWWDRQSISHFLTPGGALIEAGTSRFWRWRSRALNDATQRLSRDGATVAFVATEPPSYMIGSSKWQRFLVAHYDDLTKPWNTMRTDYAAAHPVISAYLTITDLICHIEASPCNDSIDGVSARPRGLHYEGRGIPLAIHALRRRLAPITSRLGGS